jgi:hypothetical protein
MGNSILMAVVYARKYLSNNYSGVALTESTSFLHLFKQFAAIADLVYDIVPAFIFKIFV